MLLVSTFLSSSAIEESSPIAQGHHWWLRLGNWLAEARSHRVICLVAGIWLLNAFDLTLTILAHQQGLLHEENPLARGLLRQGPWSVTVFKVVLVVLGSFPFLRFRRARITELGALVVLVTYATLAIHWSTCYELYSLASTDSFSMAEIDALSGGSTR